MKKRLFVLSLAVLLGLTATACTPDGNSSTPTADNNNSSENPNESYAGVSDDAPPPAPNQPVINVSDASEPEGEISVVVLGDSIARGYGLANVEKQRYSALLAEKLADDYADVNIANYGVDGLTGAELVEFLKNDMPAEIADSDYVLVSIGGNNILGVLTEMSGVAELMTGIDSQIITDYVKYMTATDETEKSKYETVLTTLNTLLGTVNSVFTGETFAQKVAEAVEKLQNEIPEIVSLIKEENPDAKIVIQTVFNPYKSVNISLPYIESKVELASHGDAAVSVLNMAIESLAEEQGYAVLPVYDVFEASAKKAVNAAFSILTMQLNVDPHPNATGHQLIAESYYNLIKEN